MPHHPNKSGFFNHFDQYFGMLWFLFPIFCVWVRLLVFPEYVIFDTVLVLAGFATRHVWTEVTREWEESWQTYVWEKAHKLHWVVIAKLALCGGAVWNHLARSYARVIAVCVLGNAVSMLLFGKTLIFFNMFCEAVVSAINFRELNELFFERKTGFSDPVLAAARVASLLLFEVAEWCAGFSSLSLLWTASGVLALLLYYGVGIMEENDAFAMLRSEAARQEHFYSMLDTAARQHAVVAAARTGRDDVKHEVRATWLACAQHIQNGNDSMQKGAARPLAYLLGCDLDAWQKHGKAAAQRLAQAGDAGAAIAAAAEGVAVDPEAQTSFDRMFSGMRETNALGITLWAKANLKLLDTVLVACVVFGLGVCTFYGRLADPSPPPPFGLSQVLVDGVVDLWTIVSGTTLVGVGRWVIVVATAHVLMNFFGCSWSQVVGACSRHAVGAEATMNAWLRAGATSTSARFGFADKYFVAKFDQLSDEGKERFAVAAAVTLCRANYPDLPPSTEEDANRAQQAREAVREGGILWNHREQKPSKLVHEAFKTLMRAHADNSQEPVSEEVRSFLELVRVSANKSWEQLFFPEKATLDATSSAADDAVFESPSGDPAAERTTAV